MTSIRIQAQLRDNVDSNSDGTVFERENYSINPIPTIQMSIQL